MNLPSTPQVAAAGRHVVTFAMGGVTLLAGIHLVSSKDAATLAADITQISTAVASIVAILATTIATVSGFYATWSASHKSQVAAVTKAVADGSLPAGPVANAIQIASNEAAMAAPVVRK